MKTPTGPQTHNTVAGFSEGDHCGVVLCMWCDECLIYSLGILHYQCFPAFKSHPHSPWYVCSHLHTWPRGHTSTSVCTVACLMKSRAAAPGREVGSHCISQRASLKCTLTVVSASRARFPHESRCSQLLCFGSLTASSGESQ